VGKRHIRKLDEVNHCITPNINRDSGKMDSKNKPFRSVYFETAATPTSCCVNLDSMNSRSWRRAGKLTARTFMPSCPGMLALARLKRFRLSRNVKLS
jgi:hypothetical protein